MEEPAHEPTLKRTVALEPAFAVRTLRSAGGQEAFLVGEVIGEGAIGVVEFARQRSLDRDVVLKRAKDPEDAVARAELIREAGVAGRLQHPCIVTVHGIYDGEDGHPVICMRPAPGRPWPGLREVGWAVDQHVGIAIEVCRALEFAHARGVLHLDLKPANIVVGAFGEVCLLDWGIALDRTSEGGRAEVLGTPGYIAPEMVALGELDERTDVYLLGATLFHVLFGRPPHRRSTVADSLQAASEPVRMPDVAPWLAELADICGRALRVDPDERFAGIRPLRLALTDYLAHRDAERLAHRAELAREMLRASLPPEQRLREMEVVRAQIQSALRLWPGNPRARALEQEVQTELCALHVLLGDHQAAARRARGLREMPRSLQRALEVVRKRDAGRRARRRAVEQLAPHPSLAWRTEMVTGLLVMLPPVFLTVAGVSFLAPPGVVGMAEVIGVALGWGVLLWIDPPPRRHLYELALFAAAWGVLCGVAANRMLVEAWGLPVAYGRSLDVLVVAGVAGVSTYVRPALAGVAVLLAGGAVLLPFVDPSGWGFRAVVLLLLILLLRLDRQEAGGWASER